MSSTHATTRTLTIRDIAALADVSVATVSRVMNGRPDVSEDTRESVLRVVRKHGFTTNRTARNLSSGRTGLVGLTLPALQIEYFSNIVAGAAEALYEQDRLIVLCPTQHQHDRDVGLVERLVNGATDGALLLLPTESAEELQGLRDRSYPFVVIDPRGPLPAGVPSISATHARGARQATEHLLHLGHRRIGVITGPIEWVASAERLTGYRSALAGAGIIPDTTLEAHADFQVEGGFAAATRLLALPDPPTAIFAFNDGLAIGAIRAARAQGLTVPTDLSVIGFDDSSVAPMLTPALTSVRQPLEEMGRMAVSILTRLQDSKRLDAVRVELETNLVVRDSTAPPPPPR